MTSESAYSIPGFCNLSPKDRLSHLFQLISVCSHEELLSIQSHLSQLFYRDFIAYLPHHLVVKILLRLSLKEILVCMLVSRTWYDVIHSETCTAIWKRQINIFNKNYSIYSDSYKSKFLCRQARLFQLKVLNPAAYTIEKFPLDNMGIGTETIKIFEIQNSADYLITHGLCVCGNGLYRDHALLWKWEGNRFDYKMNILEEIDTGSYVSPVETKLGSRVKAYLHANCVCIINSMYLCVFDLNKLSFTSRFLLPSMSEVMALDCVSNIDNSPKFIVIAFYDGSVHLVDASNGNTINTFPVGLEIPFNISLFQSGDLRMLIYSDVGILLFEFSEDYTPTPLPDSLPGNSNGSRLSLRLSADRKHAAILKYHETVCSKLYLFSTNNWELISSELLPQHLYVSSVVAVGSKYVVLVSDRVKLQFIICYSEQNNFVFKSVLFEGLSPQLDVFSPAHVVAMLATGWLDGDIFDAVSVENNNNCIAMFVVVSKSISVKLNILCLHLS